MCEEGFAGIMSWDLATDIDITNNKSLLKVKKKSLNIMRIRRNKRESKLIKYNIMEKKKFIRVQKFLILFYSVGFA